MIPKNFLRVAIKFSLLSASGALVGLIIALLFNALGGC